MELFDAVTIDTAGCDKVLEHIQMAIIGIFLVAEILEQIILYVARGNLRALIGEPIQELADKMKVLGAVKRHLFFGQLALSPELEERMVLAMLLIPYCNQLFVEIAAHNHSSG